MLLSLFFFYWLSPSSSMQSIVQANLLSPLAAFVIYHFSLFTLHFSFILLPSPFGEGLGVRLGFEASLEQQRNELIEAATPCEPFVGCAFRNVVVSLDTSCREFFIHCLGAEIFF